MWSNLAQIVRSLGQLFTGNVLGLVVVAATPNAKDAGMDLSVAHVVLAPAAIALGKNSAVHYYCSVLEISQKCSDSDPNNRSLFFLDIDSDHDRFPSLLVLLQQAAFGMAR